MAKRNPDKKGLRFIKGKYYRRIYIIKGESYKEKMIPLETSDQREAILKNREINHYEREIKSGENVLFPWQSGTGKTERISLRISEMGNIFLKAKKLEKLRPGTLEIYKLALEQFYKVTELGKSVKLISNNDISNFLKKYTGKISPHTLNIKLRSLKTFFRWLVKYDYIVKSPIIEQVRINKSKPVYLSNDQFTKILETIDKNPKVFKPFLKDVFYLYRDTGMRLSEPFNAEIDGNWLSIEAETSKTHSSRDIELTSKQLEIVYELRNQSHLRDERNGKIIRMTHDFGYWSKKFQEVCKKAKITGRKFHSLRHTFAVRHYLKTRDIYAVAKRLGHSNVTTTQIYTKFENRKLERDFPDLVKAYENKKVIKMAVNQ